MEDEGFEEATFAEDCCSGHESRAHNLLECVEAEDGRDGEIPTEQTVEEDSEEERNRGRDSRGE